MNQDFPFPDFDQWEDQSQDELYGLEQLPSDEDVDGKAEAAKKKANQTHRFRASLFSTVQNSLVATLAAAVGVMGFYMWSQWGDIDPAVVISFNAAVVVNTIGLAFIVANYLFPKGGGD